MDIRESYDRAAEAYARHLADELDSKPLDRHLLNRFAEAERARGLVADLGCGPGHISRYLQEQGVAVCGVDLSSGMIRVAKSLNPGIDFRVGDMHSLDLPDASLVGVVAFYSIVHFETDELGPIFEEIRRVLVPGGMFLLSFHVGAEVTHVDELFGAPVSLDFHFHLPARIIESLNTSRMAVIEHIEREPYSGVEYPSRRCYLLAKAVAP